MGMYTELHFNSELKKETPKEVINILQFMVSCGEKPESIPEHELFKSERWEYMLQMDSYYFSADTHSTIRFDEIAQSYYLCIRTNLKNYGNEIELFVEWITPYLEKFIGEFLGLMRYEETEIPTLIYHPNRFFTPHVPEFEVVEEEKLLLNSSSPIEK